MPSPWGSRTCCSSSATWTATRRLGSALKAQFITGCHWRSEQRIWGGQVRVSSANWAGDLVHCSASVFEEATPARRARRDQIYIHAFTAPAQASRGERGAWQVPPDAIEARYPVAV